MTDSKFIDFFKKYQITVLDAQKRIHKLKYPQTHGIDTEALFINTETETLYTVQLSESALHLLADMDENFFKYTGNGQDYVQDLIVHHREERLALNTNPALKEFRDQYLTMLRLVSATPQNLKNPE